MLTGRTGPSAATKRTSAFTHVIVVWLRRKVLLEWLTCIAGITHAKTGTLFCMEWRATRLRYVQEWYNQRPEMSSNWVNGRGLHTCCPA